MIYYKSGYKYQLNQTHTEMTPVIGVEIIDDYFRLHKDGLLIVRKGYAWDGASGPTIDTRNSMRPSLVHDVFCQVMRDGRLDYVKWQDTVNLYFRDQCIAAGMFQWRANLWHFAVEIAGAGNPAQGPDLKILEAP